MPAAATPGARSPPGPWYSRVRSLRSAFVLTGFTTDATVTNNPESERADERLLAAFPPDPNVKFRSHRRALVRPDGRRRGVPDVRRGAREREPRDRRRSNAQTYVDVDDGSLVSADRQATLIPVNITDADEAGDVIDVVERADADPEFAVTITGDTTLDFGFNELSARDLEEGELTSACRQPPSSCCSSSARSSRAWFRC